MILFLCHGNVARSQFAEAFLRSLGVDQAMSAGTHVSAERSGNLLTEDGPAARRAVDAFRAVTGIDIASKRRKPVTKELVDRSQRIIILTQKEDVPSFVLDQSDKVEFWEIEDPHDFDVDGYKRVIEEIERRVTALRMRGL